MRDTRLTLYDIELRSLSGVDAARFAAELAGLKLFSSPDGARRILQAAPATLARYVGGETAFSVCSTLKAIGADVFLANSHVTCPHCGFSVPCEGQASQSGRGLIFSCPACRGLTFLDSQDRKFHPLLRCNDCGSLLNLPAQPRPGKYRCRCGRTPNYEVFQGMAEVVSEKRRSRVSPRTAVLMLVFLVVVCAWTSLLPIPGLDTHWSAKPAAAAQAPAPKVRRTTAYRQFHAATDRAAVIEGLGQPERESSTEDGAQTVLFYRTFDLYVILEKTGQTYTYASTVRISDEVILHERPL